MAKVPKRLDLEPLKLMAVSVISSIDIGKWASGNPSSVRAAKSMMMPIEIGSGLSACFIPAVVPLQASVSVPVGSVACARPIITPSAISAIIRTSHNASWSKEPSRA